MPKIFVITGPSGVGKTTVAYELLKRRPTLKKVVTCTTRPPRPGETDGVDYHFLSLDEFARLKDAGAMFEAEEVYPGRFYGSRQSDVDALLAGGNDVLFVVDPKGARTIKREHPDVVTVFIDAASTGELLQRIQDRDRGATADLAARVAAIDAERAIGSECDHRVVNPHGALEATIRAVSDIMDRA